MTHKIVMPSLVEVIKEFGLNPGGRAQMYFGSRLMAISDDYVPLDGSPLKNSARLVDGGTAITYNTPYARVHWYGYVMIGVSLPKEVSAMPMKYKGGPIRGSKWVERAFNNNMDSLMKELEKVVGR